MRWREARAPARFADWPDDLAEIVYIDHYGNAMTGMRGETVAATARLACGGRTIAPAPTFSAVPPGAAFWYVNSNGLVEIAVNGGRADRLLGLSIGSTAEMRSRTPERVLGRGPAGLARSPAYDRTLQTVRERPRETCHSENVTGENAG